MTHVNLQKNFYRLRLCASAPLRLKRFLFTLVAFLPIVFVNAQEFTIKKVELTAEGVMLQYDLIDTIKSRTYTVDVYASSDKFLSPLQKIKGDAGLEVQPGRNKRIMWASREELGPAFKGEVELEVRGRIYIPFVKFNGFQAEQVIRRGKLRTLTWSGGTRQNILNFAIYDKNDKYVDVIPNVANSGSYELTLPTSIKPGTGYYFLVSDTKNKDQVMKTPTFAVKRKIPLAVKVLPILIIGGVIASQSSGKSNSTTSTDLDGPPDVPPIH
jgi:hypothetical protein